MNTADNRSKKDEKLIFANEKYPKGSEKKAETSKFKLLIVDDEKEIHVMTKLVLSDYIYLGSTLEFLSAFSGSEAKQLIKDNPDAACILLDVVMETKDAGLEVARFIREDANNQKLRIILRTGQPGKAPEKDIILNYDINDYKEKTELTTQKLFTTVTTALRSYIHLLDLDKKNQEIASKNIRLNEEIARRIVAESNLTKYNRSLEKMIENKSDRLKKAIQALKIKKTELQEAGSLVNIGNISSANFSKIDLSGESFKENLDILNKYRSDMTLLLEKYETLQNIIYSYSVSSENLSTQTHETIMDIDQFKKDIDLDEILKKFPGIIADSSKGIENISNAISDIKLFISINDEPRERTNINTIIDAVLKKCKSEFHIKFDLQTAFNDIPMIVITPKNIEKAFYEIVKNAFQAVKPNGIISISTSCENSYIIFYISDIGQGIPPESLQDIFKPYFTTNKIKAKGLGLSFAKSVIINNNGTINIASKYDEGTTVTIKFPVSDP